MYQRGHHEFSPRGCTGVLGKLGRLIGAFFLLITLLGCDTICSVQRKVQVNRLPSESEVTSALWRVPGIKNVETSYTEASTGYNFKGAIHEPAFNQYIYRLPAKVSYTNPLYGKKVNPVSFVGGVVNPSEDSEGKKWLTLYCSWMNFVPPKYTVDETRSVMDLVYRQLRESCPYLPPSTELKEKWTGASPK